MAEGEEDTGGAGVSGGGELVSPDSGMTTIRSSRSSKESSVFLSDDSPVGDVIVGGSQAGGPGGLFLRNPSPLGLSSLSPPVPPERRKHRSSRNRSDNIDLFSFDPLHSTEHSMPTGGELENTRLRGDEEERGGSSSLSELEELSLLDFSAPNSLGELERDSSVDRHGGQIHGNDMIDTVVPPTPVNSLVGSRPPSSCGVRFFPEDIAERINGLQHKDSVSSSLSETWDELGFDTQVTLSSYENNAWNRTKQSQSPQNIVEEGEDKEIVGDMTESREGIMKSQNIHQKEKSLQPQLSLITEQYESDNWSADSALKVQWNLATLADLQLTPPEEEATGKCKADIIRVKETMSRKKTLNTLTPETSKEEDDWLQRKKGDRQVELLDFWTYSAQKGFLKSDSGTTTSYPESLDMWNMTIRDDSISPLTTPDNLSENSGSFYAINPNVVEATSMESPPGFSDGGMEMWNTTIREDSSSTIASLDDGKDLSHMAPLDASESSTHEKAWGEDENGERGRSKEISEPPKDVRRGNDHNVKIVIENTVERAQGDETGDTSMESFEQSEDYQGTNMWDLPVPGMVTSTSEYDNVGAAAWSLTSSPEIFASPVVDMIQLGEQSSPFIAVTKPGQSDENKKLNTVGMTEYISVTSDKEQSANQVFLFEGTSEFSHMTKYDHRSGEESVKADWVEEPNDRSPFVLVDCSSATEEILGDSPSSPGEAQKTQTQTDQSPSQSHTNYRNLVSEKRNLSESSLSSHDLPMGYKVGPDIHENMEAKITETMSLSSSSGGERDTLKYSPDSLHPGSRDELRSNSDGDSSSGLEMEYIIVSGTVKEAEREWRDSPKQADRKSKGTRKPFETFSMLSYAATILQHQAQTAHGEQQDIYQTISGTDSGYSPDTAQTQDVSSPHYQTSHDNTAEKHMLPETVSPSQSQNISEASHETDLMIGCQTQIEEGNYDSKVNTVARSVSPSLRYSVDHFLKTREEIYVHSQISMEDSDEGGQSPPTPPQCPNSLGDIQVWGGHFITQETPQATSETHSPVHSNSSVSHTSSLIGTPLSESGVSTDRGLGLPFCGDLMDEENDDEDQEEDAERQHATLPKWTSEVQRQKEERQDLGSSDLLSFTEELIGGSSFQQTYEQKPDMFLQTTVDYCDGQPIRTAGHDEWLNEQQAGDQQASQDGCLPVRR